MLVSELWDGALCIHRESHPHEGFCEEWLAKIHHDYSQQCKLVEKGSNFVVFSFTHHHFGERRILARWFDTDDAPAECQCCWKCQPRITSEYQHD